MHKDGSLYVNGSDKIVGNVAAMIRLAKMQQWGIVVTKDTHYDDCVEWQQNGGPFPKHCAAGEWGQELIDEVSKELEGTAKTIVSKDSVSVWENGSFASKFDDMLSEYPTQVAVVVGVASDFCVKAAVAGLLERGVYVYIPQDCVRGVNEQFTEGWFPEFCSDLSVTKNRSGALDGFAVGGRIASIFIDPRFDADSFANIVPGDTSWITKEMVPEIASRIEEFILHTVTMAQKSGAVIGMSGGIDSTVVALAAHFALSRSHEVHGLHLPAGKITDEYRRARALGEGICRYFSKMTLGTTVKVMEKAMMGPTPYHTTADISPLSQFDRGNMVSRLRANFIHTYAAQHNLVVLGTGNKNEDFDIGYYTLFGDGAVHCSPLGQVPKRVVYHLAKYYMEKLEFLGMSKAAASVREAIEAAPTAGLEPDQTDFGDLGYTYAFVEFVMGTRGAVSPEIRERASRVFLYLANREFERFLKPARKYKGADWDFDTAVKDVTARHKSALMKSQIVSPPSCGFAGIDGYKFLG